MSPPSSPLPPPASSPSPDDYGDPGTRAIDLTDRPVADSLREIMASSPRLPRDQPPPFPVPLPVFRNRHWTLALVGMFFLLIAFVFAGDTVWELVAGSLRGEVPDPPHRAWLWVEIPTSVVLSLVIGLGLIFARRWARQVCLALFVESMLWAGVSAAAIGINNFPDLTGKLSAEDATPAWQYLLLLAGVGGVSWLLFLLLNHRNVRLTCEIAQSKADWTEDRSASEMLLFVMLIMMGTTWAGLACYHAWPCWGAWRFEASHWVWGAAAALAAIAAAQVARGGGSGPWLAIALTLAISSSIVLTALHQPVDAELFPRPWGAWDGFSQVWDGWNFTRRGGLAFTILTALATLTVSLAALRGQCHRRELTATT